MTSVAVGSDPNLRLVALLDGSADGHMVAVRQGGIQGRRFSGPRAGSTKTTSARHDVGLDGHRRQPVTTPDDRTPLSVLDGSDLAQLNALPIRQRHLEGPQRARDMRSSAEARTSTFPPDKSRSAFPSRWCRMDGVR